MDVNSDQLLGAAGIAVSIGTFWIGYKQTLGARQERVRSADADVERSLLKRIVLQNYFPELSDIQEAIAGMATIARVPVAALRDTENLLNLLLMRVLENDLIENNRRIEIISRLRILMPRSSAESKATVSGERDRWREKIRNVWAFTIIGLVVASAGIGTLAFALTSKANLVSKINLYYFALAILTVAVVAVIVSWRPRRSAVSVAATGNVQRANELKEYPPDSDVRASIVKIANLSSLAVAALRWHYEAEVESISHGWPCGLNVRAGGTPWHQELKKNGYLAATERPTGAIAKPGEEYVVLTGEGQLLGRVLGANSTRIPRPLIEMYAESGAGDTLANEFDHDPVTAERATEES